MPLGLGTRLRSFRLQPTVTAIGLQLARFDAIVQKPGKNFVDDEVAQLRSLDWKRDFNPTQKIPRHPIGAGKVHFRLAAIFKTINAAVLEKTANDTHDTDVVAQSGDFGTQTADSADNQVDSDLGIRRFVKIFDDLLVDERIELGHAAGWFAGQGVVPLALDFR